ncbi:hypothetical protein [Solemya elarraichensis gill symbiont]|uniref:Uncharacterized protein n=1 Tax=Solemya elarraichensis gill symbiont TaxID=1918949 RepID=A0A1T2KYN8_9GAMM|nr:hypothetical protein [Solemya elarraichensis gill symbiont]OOZ37969.1 hypothetical protein BOW52_09765 [Solemya elarraichensis gill symbiont]
MGGGGGNTTTTTIAKLPEFAQPYQEQLLEQGAALSGNPYEAYGGEMIAGFDPAHNQAMDVVMGRASAGSPMLDAAQQYGISQMNGEMNPYVNDIIMQNAADMTQAYNDITNPYFTSQDVASGAFGNSGLQQARLNSMSDLTENVGEMANNVRYGAWNDQQNRGMSAMGMAPTLAEADYMDADKMMGVGDMLRDYEQSQLNEQYANWQAEQMWPYQQLDLLGNTLRQAVAGGGSTTTSAPNAYASNPYANILGGGLMLSSVPGLLGMT